MIRTAILFILCVFSSVSLQSQSFQSIEAVEYDPLFDRWLISNGSSIIAQDALGQLSYFGEGTASHGMEVMNGVLYAVSGELIKGYDLTSGEEVLSFDVPGTGFLNGMGSDPGTDRLWISDFSNSRIYQLDVSDLDNPILDPIISDTESTPNGVVYDQLNDRIVFVNWGMNAPIKMFDLNTMTMSTLVTTGLNNIDGIDMDASGNFYVSSWSPQQITRFNSDFSESEVIPATGLSNPADISYSTELQTLGVANSGNETLTLITFAPSSTVALDGPHQLQLFPNPVNYASRVEFELNDGEDVELYVLDSQGRMVSSLHSGTLSSGDQQFIMDASRWLSGHYFMCLRVDGETRVKPFVVNPH